MRQVGAPLEDLDLGEAVIKENELKMAIQLAEMGAAEEFHPENYRDEVQERIRGLIQKKVEGEEIIGALTEEPKAQVIDLMEALRASLGGGSARPKATATKEVSKMPVRAEQKRKPAKSAAARKPAAAKTRAR